MRKKLVIILGAVVLVATTGVLVYAQRSRAMKRGLGEVGWMMGDGGGGQYVPRRLARMARHLELTDAQREQVKTILSGEREAVAPLIKQLRETREALNTASRAIPFDESKVRELAGQQGQTLTAMIVERERIFSQIYQVLTPEQRAKADSMRSGFGGGRMHGRPGAADQPGRRGRR